MLRGAWTCGHEVDCPNALVRPHDAVLGTHRCVPDVMGSLIGCTAVTGDDLVQRADGVLVQPAGDGTVPVLGVTLGVALGGGEQRHALVWGVVEA